MNTAIYDRNDRRKILHAIKDLFLLLLITLILLISRNTDQIDAVSVSGLVRNIVSKMSTRRTDAFTILQASHQVPVGFFIAKTGPSVRVALLDKFRHGTSDGSGKETLSSHTIVKVNWSFWILAVLSF